MLAAGAASAGTCGADVAALQQQLGLQQGANATIGATYPGVQQPSPSPSVDSGPSVDSSASVDSGAGAATTMDSDQVANSNSGANATVGASDPGVQQPAPEANATTGANTGTSTDTNNGSSVTTADNTGANATIGATDPGVQQPNGGGSDAMANSSSSSSSSTLSPTIAETSRAGEMNTAAGGHAEAITALKKAQLQADAGNEEACMTELNAAKASLGIQ
jgi:hypothetical protein